MADTAPVNHRRIYGDPADEYRYVGDFSATPLWHSRHMTCHSCRVSWTGCWDNFQCPKCGEGELPDFSGPLFNEDAAHD